MEFPYAHFGTQGATADFLYPIMWEAVRLLEADGIKVLCITAYGDSPNRKFFKMHKTPDLSVPYKAKNPYAKDKQRVYFISDPPHLIKTVRNCWSHSSINGTRHMEVRKSSVVFHVVEPVFFFKVNGQHIEWKQLWDVNGKISALSVSSMGLTIAPKLKWEHLQLTTY